VVTSGPIEVVTKGLFCIELRAALPHTQQNILHELFGERVGADLRGNKGAQLGVVRAEHHFESSGVTFADSASQRLRIDIELWSGVHGRQTQYRTCRVRQPRRNVSI
jgi:hypothetical protein